MFIRIPRHWLKYYGSLLWNYKMVWLWLCSETSRMRQKQRNWIVCKRRNHKIRFLNLTLFFNYFDSIFHNSDHNYLFSEPCLPGNQVVNLSSFILPCRMYNILLSNSVDLYIRQLCPRKAILLIKWKLDFILPDIKLGRGWDQTQD